MSKNVLITGASGGIGSAAARLFAKNGYNVIINYNSSEQDALSLEKELSCIGNAVALKADVSSKSDVDAMFTEAEKLFGKINVLVNNAGISQQKLFTDITEEEFDRMFSVNVKGVFNCCQRALPSMIHDKSGKIINVSSMWGISGASCEVHYSASKAAVIGLTKALAREVGLSGVQVNCVAPGVIETKMNSHLSEKIFRELEDSSSLGRTGTPEEVAELIYFLSDNKSDFITGQTVCIDGGFI